MGSSKYTIQDFLEAKASVNASFSPDMKKVCYLNTDTGTPQVYLLDLESGKSEQLTNYPDAISYAQFSPKEHKILFQMASGGNEQSQLFFLDPETKEATSITNNEGFRHDFGAWSPDGSYISYRSNERNGTDFDAYVMNVRTGEKKCVFTKGGWITAGIFSPSNTYLVVSQQHSNADGDVYLCDLKTGETEHLTEHEGDEYYGSARWLPDESAFFITTDRDREFTGLARYELTRKTMEYVLTPEWDIDGTVIDTDGKRLVLTVNEDGYDRVRIYDALTFEETPSMLPEGGLIGKVRFSPDNKKLLFNFTDSTRTQDVWLYDLETQQSKQLTHSEQSVPSEVMVAPKVIRFESFDGLSVSAFVYKPKHIGPGKKLPVIFEIHGGPEAQFRPSFIRIIQYYVYKGYAVIAPNVRGSSGYGKTYQSLDNVEKRLDSVKDLVALHNHLRTMSDIDNNKVVLSGGSYGGFMVLAGLAFYPELWAAGVDIVGIANFITFLQNTASYRRSLREAEYGSLQDDRELLKKISPINSVEKIQAPLMVIHGANDPRVPLSEAEQIVEKLKERKKEVELLVYSDEGHGLAKLKNRLDAYPRVVDFLDRVLHL